MSRKHEIATLVVRLKDAMHWHDTDYAKGHVAGWRAANDEIGKVRAELIKTLNIRGAVGNDALIKLAELEELS